jgi:polar amino acid transport system permease protein
MGYQLQFGQITADIPYILGGAAGTLSIALTSFVIATVMGLALALAKEQGGPVLRRAASAWITFFMNTPALVLLFFLFNALPEAGILLSPMQAALIGFTVNASAYLAEIQRAGILSVRQAELDAAAVLGMSRLQTVRHVIAPHIAKTVYPPMSNFFIFMLLGTSMAGLIGVDELTGRAITVASRTFRSIEVFLVTGGIYIVLTLLATIGLALAGRLLFRVKARIV